jgi:hypothetical protein
MRDGETKDACKARRREEDARPEMVVLMAATKAKALDLALAKIGVPERALSVARSPRVTPAIQAVAALHPHGMLILSGGVGTGKTVAAGRWILDYVEAKPMWRFGRDKNIDDETTGYMFEFLGNAHWASSAELARVDHYDPRALAVYRECERLVIDDLGTEFMDAKGFFLSLLNEIVDERYSRQLATVMTTNCGQDDFSKRYRERIVDRVREAGQWFACGDESLRGAPPVGEQLRPGQ